MIKTKKYKIEGLDRNGKPVTVKAIQKELTYDQDKELIFLFEGLSIQDLAQKGLKGVFKYLDERQLFEKFFDIILSLKQPVSEQIVLGTVQNSTLIEMMEDFFLLNRKSIEKLIASFQGRNLQEAMIHRLQSWMSSVRDMNSKSPDQKPSTK